MEPDQSRRIRAVALLSGGLDSQLAVCVLREQGIEVHGVAFDSPFFDVAPARRAASQLAIPLEVINFTADIVSLVNKPRHGFGACMNPCLDCHARMLKRAGERMEEWGFRFLSTGEVLNERPMSQTREGLRIVGEDSGYGGWVVRPLSGRLLPVTRPEQMGWVDRSRLLSIEGRSRKQQLALAARYGLADFPTPAGGCRLTEPNFCVRLRDLKEHEGLAGERSLALLRFGRHFRLAPNLKLIVGRDENDNAALEGLAELYDFVIRLDGLPGPTGLVPMHAAPEQLERAAAICARYADCAPGVPVAVKIRSPQGIRRMQVIPAEPSAADALRV